jgi:hypothetical protein
VTEPTKPTTRTKQYRLDVLGGRAIGALTDVLAAKEEEAFYQLKTKANIIRSCLAPASNGSRSQRLTTPW